MKIDSKPDEADPGYTLLPFYFDDNIVEYGFVAIHGGLAAAEAPLNHPGFAVARGWRIAFMASDVGVHVIQQDN